MLATTTSNWLHWDDISQIKFPPTVQPLIQYMDWSQAIWQTQGLPLNGASYSLVGGKSLYLDNLADGTASVQKQEFTGRLTASIFLIDEKDLGDSHYVVGFDLYFENGELMETKTAHLEVIPKNKYEENFKVFEAKYSQNLKIKTSFWYLKIYIPYRYVVRGLFFLPIVIVHFLKFGLVWLMRKLTPL